MVTVDRRELGGLACGPAAARAGLHRRGTATALERERLEIGFVAAMGAHAVHATRLGIEAAHRGLTADGARTSHDDGYLRRFGEAVRQRGSDGCRL